MNLSDVKLVVTDMDGTLLNSKHQVSDLFFKQFEALRANNIHFVAASGRQYHSILDKLSAIKEHITIVAENGAYIVQNDEELYVNAISQADVENLLQLCTDIDGVHLVVCGKNKAYILNESEQFQNTIAEYYTEYMVLNSFSELPDDDFFKIALCHHDGSEEFIYPFVKHLENDWQIKISGKLWIDISQDSSHKGNAIAQIQKQHGVTKAQTMAFGDYNNDLEMLKKASFSYAMENAHPNVKKVAKYHTLTNDNNGVEAVLATLLASINP
ncbi:HAD family hydrolase [Aquimarina agarivorans]|uniref:HAD family hydrolase n=1 Tax=Aquimarina agarivorans TaxID=980584 RepID=UPI0004983F57|nr:HAD family hydrolase [Aquimarina agarivorans]